MAVRVQSLPCPNCGASLRWNGEASVVECRYCQTHVAVDTGAKTSLPSEVISQARASRRAVVITALLVGALVVGGAVMAMCTAKKPADRPSEPPVRTSTAAELMATPLAATAEEVAARHGVKTTGKNVDVMLSESPYGRVTFSWVEDHPEHVQSIRLNPRDETARPPEILERARAVLGRKLRGSDANGYQFSSDGTSLSIDRYIYLSANDRERPDWNDRFATMWNVVQHAAFGAELELDDQQRRAFLDLGYPLASIGTIGFDVPLETATDAVRGAAPAAAHDGTDYSITLDHPWFENASLRWENKANGAWSNLTLYYPIETTLPDIAEPLTECLRPLLGEPKKLEQDHAAGTYSLQYAGRKGNPWVDVGTQTFQVYLRYSFGDPATAEGFSALIERLAGCPATP